MIKYCLTFFSIILISFSSYATEVGEHILPSGKTIKIKAIGKMYFSKGDPALALEYETDSNLNDVESLRKEVEEIWPIFRVNVENDKMTNAVIKASEPKKKTGLITYKYNSRNFVINQKSNGTWKFFSWGRDYEKEEIIITDKFLSNLQSNDIPNTANCMHYPDYFTKEQLEDEIRGISKILTIVNNKLGFIESYQLNDNPIFYKYLSLQNASQEYWNKYPVFNAIIYNVKYTKCGNGYIIFRFSILNEQLVINSILFGLPADKPEIESLFKELNDSIIKALSNTSP